MLKLSALALAGALIGPLVALSALAQDAAPAPEAPAPQEEAPQRLTHVGPPTAKTAPVISPDGKMYAEFGGHAGLVSLMDDFMTLLVVDPRTHDFFVAAKRDHIKAELVDQFCVILGGGCTYNGKDMKVVHSQLGIREADFNALVEDLQITMDKHHIAFATQNKLLAALAPQHRDVVTAH